MNLHFSAFIVVELLPNGRLKEIARRRLSHVTQHKGNSILTCLKTNETRSAVWEVLEKANIPCLRESVWSMACLPCDRSPEPR